MHQSPFLWRNHFWMQSIMWSTQTACVYRNSTAQVGEEATSTFRYHELSVQICEPFCRLISISSEGKWNRIYQDIYETAKTLIKRNVCNSKMTGSGYTSRQMHQELALELVFYR